MVINNISLTNFRKYADANFSFQPNINVLWGCNGVGKTSILEAISVCSISKSFVLYSESSLVRIPAHNDKVEAFFVSANCNNDINVPYKISVEYKTKKQKTISNSFGKNITPKELIGYIPLVVIAPSHKNITIGSPEYRRSFVDGLLSQCNKIYLAELYELKKILKNRNKLLSEIGKLTDENIRSQYMLLLEHWTNMFIAVCSKITIRRQKFINEYAPLFYEAYKQITEKAEEISIKYSPDIGDIGNEEKLKEQYLQRASKLLNGELKQGCSLFGVQKDDFIITLNNGNAREVASQGQHKSILIALKMAEFQYLQSKNIETPIILMDDIFSELDTSRIAQVMKMVEENNVQIFITLTDPKIVDFGENVKINYIEIK